MGIAHTADCILGLITSEELEGMGQIMFKQLKNRWNDLGYYRRFVIGINRGKMRIFDLESSAQGNVFNEPKTERKEQGTEQGNTNTGMKLKSSTKKLKSEGLK
jgi:hypothetical protein